jgi:hypothetical protein
MAMVKGTLVTGRVTDRQTGEPVKGVIRYATLSGNKHLLGLPGKDAYGSGSMTHDIDRDGKFSLIAPPGPGILLVQARPAAGGGKAYPDARIRPEDRGKPYLRNDGGLLGARFVTSRGILQPLWSYQGYRVIEPAVGAEGLTADLELEPGKAVAGKVVGPDGKPLTGATASGLTGSFGQPAALSGDTFTAQALLPDDSRTVFVLHEGKKLAGSAVIRAGAKEAPVVRLAAWGAVTGRVVDADGSPVAGAVVRVFVADRTASVLHQRLAGGKPLTTDKDGRFRGDVPFAGVKFGVFFLHKGRQLEVDRPVTGLTVKAGETKALGDLAAK